jgi:hypothetical protein
LLWVGAIPVEGSGFGVQGSGERGEVPTSDPDLNPEP